jgi:hypothetical protein
MKINAFITALVAGILALPVLAVPTQTRDLENSSLSK